MNKIITPCTILVLCLFFSNIGKAQTPPTSYEQAQHSDFHKAVVIGDLSQVESLIQQGINLEQKDSAGRTALHLVAYESNEEMFTLLIKSGSNVNALENDDYDVVTIAAVANDIEMLSLALSFNGNAKNTTSPYEGTALIASAHLGHVEVVDMLLKANSNVNHVNNLGWTALLEAIILGDGSSKYIKIITNLLEFGADKNLADNQGVTPQSHARQRGYDEIISVLKLKY